MAWALGRRRPSAAPIVKRRATSVPTFAPAATYVGRRPGYKFTAGARGVGYYLTTSAQPPPRPSSPSARRPTRRSTRRSSAWWVAETRAASDHHCLRGPGRGPLAADAACGRQCPGLGVVLGGAALERGAAKAPEAGVIAASNSRFGGDVRPIDGAHLALQAKIFGAQQSPPS